MADEKSVATVDPNDARRRQAKELANDGREFTPAQITTIKNNLAKGATDEELKFFIAVCSRTGLDPFLRQIYWVERYDPQLERKIGTIQVGIDGYRAMASSTGLYDGQDAPQWCGPDGRWVELWLEDGPPFAARVAVYRKDVGRPIVGLVRYSAFVQKKKGGEPNKMWATMPAEMLAKCAEAQALRKAFPKDLGGITTTEEALVAEPRDARAAALPGVRAAAERSVAEVVNGHDEDPDDSVAMQLDEAMAATLDTELKAEVEESLRVAGAAPIIPPDELLAACTKARKVLGRAFLKEIPAESGKYWFVDQKVVMATINRERGWQTESFLIVEGGVFPDEARAQAIYAALRAEIDAAVARVK